VDRGGSISLWKLPSGDQDLQVPDPVIGCEEHAKAQKAESQPAAISGLYIDGWQTGGDADGAGAGAGASAQRQAGARN